MKIIKWIACNNKNSHVTASEKNNFEIGDKNRIVNERERSAWCCKQDSPGSAWIGKRPVVGVDRRSSIADTDTHAPSRSLFTRL